MKIDKIAQLFLLNKALCINCHKGQIYVEEKPVLTGSTLSIDSHCNHCGVGFFFTGVIDIIEIAEDYLYNDDEEYTWKKIDKLPDNAFDFPCDIYFSLATETYHVSINYQDGDKHYVIAIGLKHVNVEEDTRYKYRVNPYYDEEER